ncbi:MAG: HK97 family phage prohead protease [Nitrospinaceae bacterium]|nr:HK97 family phage prohead protease [Nitrospinaceae bacterium]
MKEIKSFPFKMDAINDAGEFCGYASTFGSIDLGGDVVEKGAYKKTLIESNGRFPILDHHDPTRQIGWNVEAYEDERGLFVRGLLDLNVTTARERHSLMKMAQSIGGRTGLSIGFRVIKEEADPRRPEIRRLKEVQLMEYSVVTFPMNQQAGIISVKSKEEMIGQFLKNAVGMDSQQTRLAIRNLKSLLATKNEPGKAHSWTKGADYQNTRMLRQSLRQLLNTVKEA